MTTINNGGPAFPVVCENGLGHISDGMTLRDYFAGQALQGLLSREKPFSFDAAAEKSYELADAMLSAREAK